MSFFQSDIVQAEMKEISDLQEEIYASVFTFSSMSLEQKLRHVELLENLLKKQQVLYARMSLSDDPEAKKMKDSILTAARQLGFPADVDLAYVFKNMTNVVDNMKQSLRES
jgi:hypothetical protein